VNPFDIALFAAAIRLSVPLLLAALGELVSERAGVINIGLEGMMLFGAYAAFLTAYGTGSVGLGLAAGVGVGLLAAAIMSFVAINLRGDQIVVGVAINLLAAGVTLFLYRLQFEGSQPTTVRMDPFAVPVLSEVPLIGPVLFDQLPLVYLAYGLAPAVAFLLYRTRRGLMLRSAGEKPEVLHAAGTDVIRTQWTGVLTAGALAGLGGAFLSVGQVGLFAENMTAGRGFLALAAVVFGQWRPYGVVVACVVFGFTDALQLRLQSMGAVPREVWVALVVVGIAAAIAGVLRARRSRSPLRWVVLGSVLCVVAGLAGAVAAPHFALPSQFWLSLPYVLSLLALATSARGVRAPSMVGRPLPSLRS
jgi:general nucleoside transport system permease protein